MLFPFSSLESVFAKQAPNFCHSWFLVTGIAFSDTIFNVYEPGDHFSSRAHNSSGAAETAPPTLSTSTAAAHYQEHVAKGGASTKINLIACIALQNHSRGGKTETSERKEKKGWEGGKEQEWGRRPHGPIRLKFNGWVLVLNCDLRFGWALTVACLISHCHSHPGVYLQQGVNSASWILNYQLPTASSARTAETLPRNQHATQGSILSSGIKINITCHISCLSSFHALSSGNEG